MFLFFNNLVFLFPVKIKTQTMVTKFGFMHLFRKANGFENDFYNNDVLPTKSNDKTN